MTNAAAAGTTTETMSTGHVSPISLNRIVQEKEDRVDSAVPPSPVSDVENDKTGPLYTITAFRDGFAAMLRQLGVSVECECDLEDDEQEEGIGLDTGANSHLDDFQSGGGGRGSTHAFIEHYLVMDNFSHVRKTFDNESADSTAIIRLCVSGLQFIIEAHDADAAGDRSRYSTALNLVAPTLRIFSRLPSACDPMCTSPAIALLCTTLRDVIGLPVTEAKSSASGPTSPDAGVHLVATIANLALIDAARSPLHALQVVPILISRILHVSKRKIAFIEHLAALSNLCCFETSFLRDVVACNGHLVIQQALARYPMDVFDREVLLHGLHITAAVSRLSSEHDKQFLAFAFEKLRERLWDTSLQGAGLSTLGNLYANSESVRPALCEPDVARYALKAVKRYQDDSPIVLSACFLLGQVLRTQNGDISPVRQELIDALPMLLAATNRFRWHESLQTTALFMFSVLSCDAPLRKHLLSHDVPHVIFRACMTDFKTRTVDAEFARYVSNKDLGSGIEAFVRSTRSPREACRSCENSQECECDLEDDEQEEGIGLDTGVNSHLDDFQSGGGGGSASEDDADTGHGEAPPQTRGEAFAQMRRRAAREAGGITTKDSGMTMEDIRALYLGPSLMLLGEKVQDQRDLISMGALQALYHCIEQSKRQRVTLMLHFVLQRLIKSLKSHILYILPTKPASLLQLAQFYVTTDQGTSDAAIVRQPEPLGPCSICTQRPSMVWVLMIKPNRPDTPDAGGNATAGDGGLLRMFPQLSKQWICRSCVGVHWEECEGSAHDGTQGLVYASNAAKTAAKSDENVG